MLSDLRCAFRQLAKSPGFRAVATFALALSIGATSAPTCGFAQRTDVGTTTVSFLETDQQLNHLAGRGVALADFNGDGKLDAFVVNENSPDGQDDRVYFGDGRGRFTDSGQLLAHPPHWESRPALGDVDGDGKPDAITGKTVWINDGKGHFTARPDWIESAETGELCVVRLADLNGDGSPDLVAIHEWKSLRVYLNDGLGRFRDTGQVLGSGIVDSLALGDVNGDGAVDAISAGWRNHPGDPCPNRVWLNDGKGNFRDSGEVLDEGEHHAHGIALGDVNGDGALDVALALTADGGAGKVYMNDGHGRFRDSGQTLAHRWAHAVALGDLDDDGSLDAFFACGDPATGTPNEVWLNDGHGSFHDSGLRLGNAFSSDVALGDLNGDGKLDAIVSNLRIADAAKSPPVFGGAPLEVWLNTAPTSIAFDYLGQPPPGATPEVFARGIVSTDDNEHSAPSFSPDGSEVFWYANRPPGPANKKWLSFSRTMRRENGRWSAPRLAPFGEMVRFSPDGRRVYFDTKADIWTAEKQGDHWSEPRCLGIAARFPELEALYMPSATRAGTLYFIGHALGPRGDLGIYRAELVNGEYAKPQLLPPAINQPGRLNWAPFIAPDESFLLFSSNRRDPDNDPGDLYISRRLAGGNWTEPVSLGAPVNTPRQEVFPGLSPDGKYLFFARDTPGHDNDIYWVEVATIPALSFTSNSQQEIPR